MLILIIISLLYGKVNLLDNGIALTPPMGWMSWGYYMCNVNCETHPEKCLNEELILSVADEFYHNGYQEVGYEYIIIDDCWSEMYRDDDGLLVPDHKRFPRGMKFIADYIHSKGLKFGLYTSAGDQTCMGYPGSRDHLELDAKTFASWDVDYVKFDGCFVEEAYLNTVYIEFGNYLNETGRPMVYSCSWPYYIEFIYKKIPDYKSVAKHCNLWRNYHDVVYDWGMVKYIIHHYETEYKRMATYMGPGHWNDPDMLILGANKLTQGQSRIQLAVYVLLSAPLLLSCDMKKISKYEKQLLQNQDLIAIGQDPMGVQAVPYQLDNQVTLWIKRHHPKKGNKLNSYSLAIVNLDEQIRRLEIMPRQYGVDYDGDYVVMDIFSQKFLRNMTMEEFITVSVPTEDVIFYTLYPL